MRAPSLQRVSFDIGRGLQRAPMRFPAEGQFSAECIVKADPARHSPLSETWHKPNFALS